MGHNHWHWTVIVQIVPHSRKRSYRGKLRYSWWFVWSLYCGPFRFCESAIVKSTGDFPNNPIQSLEEVVPGDRTTGDDVPLMGLDRGEV